MSEYKMMIGGQLVDAVDGKTMDVTNPANGEYVATVPCANEKDVELAVAAAKAALPGWKKTYIGRRAELIFALANKLHEHAEELARLETVCMGAPISKSLAFDAKAAPGNLEFIAGAGRAFYGNTISANPNAQVMTIREPLGVVGLITPWNFPMTTATSKLAPALITGNTVVLKPASCAPLSCLKIGEYAKEVGFPDGVINVICGPGSTAGEAIVKHKDVAKINFTGDSHVGKRIMYLASEYVKPVASELGGKNAFIVLEDANIAAAVETGVYSAFFNTGQNCGSPSRFYIHEKVYDEFKDKFIAAAEKITVGDTMDPKTMMGPLAYMGARDNAEAMIEEALKDGCKLLSGGVRPDTPETKNGAFLLPTILEVYDNKIHFMQEEVFAPVVGFYKISSAEEAIDLTNDNDYGLCASVWTEDFKKGMRVIDQIDTGTTWINQHLEIVTETPWGGRKQSGWTKENSAIVLEEYTYQKHVWINMSDEPHTFWEGFLKDIIQ